MSGYRSLHRETLGSYPIWGIATCPILGKSSLPNAAPKWRFFTACGDGLVRAYLVEEKSLEEKKDVLDASACTCTCTHLLLGKSQQAEQEASSTLGCSQIQLARNYVGDDDKAGELLIVTLNLAGRIRIWQMTEDADQDFIMNSLDQSKEEVTQLKAIREFQVDNATGTCLRIVPPNISGVGDVYIAVACLDGTVAYVATGISTPKATKEPIEAGTVIERWSKAGSIGMSMAWHPTKKNLAIGRQDGPVEMLGDKPHRLVGCHETPVRTASFTPDGHLLVTASDDGMLAVWDCSRPVPALVHHVVQAHDSWILNCTMLSDSRRFVTSSADRTLHVWNVGQMDQAVHTFTCDGTAWALSSLQDPPRLLTGTEDGGLQIYSLES